VPCDVPERSADIDEARTAAERLAEERLQNSDF
jgi:hypothetical protein